MLKDITLGQYFPGNTVVHRLDPRTKLILVIVYIVALFTAKNYVSYLLMLAVLAGCVAVSGISIKTILNGLKPVIVIVIITAMLNLFYTSGDVIWSFWILKIT